MYNQKSKPIQPRVSDEMAHLAVWMKKSPAILLSNHSHASFKNGSKRVSSSSGIGIQNSLSSLLPSVATLSLLGPDSMEQFLA